MWKERENERKKTEKRPEKKKQEKASLAMQQKNMGRWEQQEITTTVKIFLNS